MASELRTIARNLKREMKAYRMAITDPRTPRAAKWLLGIAVAYFLSPIDIIPDFIPVLGHVDDLLIVPGLVYLALKMIPPAVMADCRARAAVQTGPVR